MAIDKITTPAVTDDSVTLAKMAPGTDGNIISYDASGNPVAVATGTAGQILTSAGAGAPPTFATLAAGGITHVDKWKLDDGTYADGAVLNGNWARVTTINGLPHGTGLTESSGVFTFPVTGLYEVLLTSYIYKNATLAYAGPKIQGSTSSDFSSHNDLSLSYGSIPANGAHDQIHHTAIFEVTNTANNKIRSKISSAGDCGYYQTTFTFIRLADV